MDARTSTEGHALSTEAPRGPSYDGAPDDRLAAELALEQAAVDLRYRYLDDGLRRAVANLDRVRRGPTAGTPGALTERDAFDALYSERAAALRAAEDRLVFGRMDLVDGPPRYIGRIGLSDEQQEQLLHDWRSPAAEPFYRATAHERLGVTRRRHLTTSGRTVTHIEDDVLDLDAHGGSDAVQGGGSLMAALGAHRTGRMRDIVATIQAEQDRIIRSPLAGVLVVQGAPGCGKTVVALHRAAYLLYTHRDRIARAGVLVVGPNRQFLRYIEQVLPSLGETSAVLVTQGQLYPGVDAEPDRDRRSALVKGDLRAARMVANAVAALPRVPGDRVPLQVGGATIALTPRMVESSIAHARRTRKPHNEARRDFVLDLLGKLASQLAQRTHVDLHDHREGLLEELRDSVDVRRAVNLAWMPWTPERLLRRLYADEGRLAAAAPWLTAEERAALARDADAPWEVGDVPLLDEAAELLGVDDEQARLAALAADRESAAELAYAREVAAQSGSGMVTADMLVARYAGPRSRTSVADAENDRTWRFGHVVVDEAQELSPMAWRVVARRCPSLSMTVVGDVNQTGSPAGVTDWREVFDPLARGRWTVETLTVNYRTPRPVMELAVADLRAAGVDVADVVSAREGDEPRTARVADLAALPGLVVAELDRVAGGRVAVIAAAHEAPAVAGVLVAALPDAVGVGDSAVDHLVAVLTPATAKGLEFDAVVVVNAATIAAAEWSGPRDRYVACTRTTAHLLLVDVR